MALVLSSGHWLEAERQEESYSLWTWPDSQASSPSAPPVPCAASCDGTFTVLAPGIFQSYSLSSGPSIALGEAHVHLRALRQVGSFRWTEALTRSMSE